MSTPDHTSPDFAPEQVEPSTWMDDAANDVNPNDADGYARLTPDVEVVDGEIVWAPNPQFAYPAPSQVRYTPDLDMVAEAQSHEGQAIAHEDAGLPEEEINIPLVVAHRNAAVAHTNAARFWMDAHSAEGTPSYPNLRLQAEAAAHAAWLATNETVEPD